MDIGGTMIIKRFTASVAVVVAVALFVPQPASAAVSSAQSGSAVQAKAPKYATCKQLNKRFRAGVVASRYFADRAVEQGFRRPKINSSVYYANYPRLKGDVIGVMCPVLPAMKPPTPPANVRGSTSESSSLVFVNWDNPAAGNEQGTLVFDIYRDGTLVAEGLEPSAWNQYMFRDLTPGQTYTVAVLARNALGSSEPTAASITVPSAETIANYGKSRIEYEVSGSAGSYSITAEAADGSTFQRDVGNGVVLDAWIKDGNFIYLSAQNNTGGGTVTCTIRKDGRVYKQTTSEGAYVIATCSGTA